MPPRPSPKKRRITRSRLASRKPQSAGRAGERTKPFCSLERALAYENRQIVYGFMEKYAVSFREANALFTELKKFLWLIVFARRRGLKPPFITDDIQVIDEMWHTFVLFTAEYRKYCDDCYGFYIDHAPTTKAERDRAMREQRADPVGDLDRWNAELRDRLSLIYDVLGPKTVWKWYRTLSRRYSKSRLEELRRKQAERGLPAGA